MNKAILVSTLLAFAVTATAALDVKAKLDNPKPGDNLFTLTFTDGGKPVSAKVTLAVAMTNMDMGTTHPKVEEKKDDKDKGTYTATVDFSMAGPWRVTATIEVTGQKKIVKKFDYKVVKPSGDGMTMDMGRGDMGGMKMDGMSMMGMDGMKGKLGAWSMSKEGSGTSLLPEDSPMFMKEFGHSGRYALSLMGFFDLNYSDAGGKRGDDRFYSNSMPMLMARRETGGGILGFNLMVSLDPIFNGEYGYPNLFQTGETAHGKSLVDYQHPHDLVSELSVSYSKPIGGGANAFAYIAPVGEPALGGPTFAHRPSGMEIPEAPISHHWFDSTHISYGVVTAGLNNDKFQLEGSVFNGHEPDENRYCPDPIQFNSWATRLTYNPTKRLSFNTSYGFLDSPERQTPDIDQHRFTAAGIFHIPNKRDSLDITAAFGRLYNEGKDSSDAFLLEGTYYLVKDSLFARWENVDKDELIGVPDGSYKINKFILGGIKNVRSMSGFDVGLGGYVGLYDFPASLDPYYSKTPVTLGVFLRVRPGRM